ncbi:hypothetical protein [Burkholderia pseudomallei]|uniref:hypothetical protein n=1 Tax=Burkholderia pseudomallei TaxID=28450 RepID=UPI000536EE57|nr:hypothetical protein [Burkholderia pseudomallei]KGX55332.1 hypothetical protein Y027_4045 [Burkholderia pseudomallei TSV5]MBM5692202.1 hypothetical protein [Burkholderia pseudomallei]
MNERKEDRLVEFDLSGVADTLACGREAEALQQMKQIHAKDGTPLTREQEIGFLVRPVYLGPPESRRKARGRKPAWLPTQYDAAIQRRRDLYRRKVKLPILRNGTGHIDRVDIERRLEECRAKKIPRHKWVKETCDSLAIDGKPFEERTVRRIKKNWESRNFGK